MMYPAFSNQGMFGGYNFPSQMGGVSYPQFNMPSMFGGYNPMFGGMGSYPSYGSMYPSYNMFSQFMQQPMMPQQFGGGSDMVNAQPYGGSQFGRDIGFGLMSLSNPIANFIGRAITGNEIDAIDRGFSNLPTTTGGDDSWLSSDGNENNGSNYSGPSDTYGGADAGTGDDDQWD